MGLRVGSDLLGSAGPRCSLWVDSVLGHVAVIQAPEATPGYVVFKTDDGSTGDQVKAL